MPVFTNEELITDGTDTLEISAAGAAIVDGSAVTQPISAASLPLPTGAATLAGQTQPGVDIGDVTVNNAAGASAVNIQDGGNTITVDGSVTTTPYVSGTATVTQVVLTANTNATLLAANAARVGAVVFIPSQPAFVKFGTTASSTSFTYRTTANNSTIEFITGYTGRIDILSQNGQTVTVTEF